MEPPRIVELDSKLTMSEKDKRDKSNKMLIEVVARLDRLDQRREFSRNNSLSRFKHRISSREGASTSTPEKRGKRGRGEAIPFEKKSCSLLDMGR